MIRMYVLPLVAILGSMLAFYTVRASNPVKPSTQPVALPAVSPFDHYVAGAGLIEASTENIAVGTVVGGVVKEIHVKVNDHVKANDPLFSIDDRNLMAALQVQRAMLASAQQELAKLRDSPRPEDLPPLEAKVAASEASRANAQREFDRLTRIGDSARSDEMDRARWDLAVSKANVDAANAELARVKAGAWAADVAIAQAKVDAAAAQVRSIEVDLERLIVRSPVDGTVMQVKVRKGEYAPAGAAATPLMLIGDIDTLHLRVDIDENDAWRVQPGARATANIRGNRELKSDLSFVRIEPYIIPKRSLTGDSNERVDTRVLQVVYSFDAEAFQKQNGVRVYAGQQMDVFIEVKD